MPPRTNQSNSAMYSAVFFAAVFIAATVFAVIFYLKAEDNRKLYEDSSSELREMAKGKERTQVGKRLSKKSYLGTMHEYVNQLTDKIGGVDTEDATADVRMQEMNASLDGLMQELEDTGFEAGDQSLIRTMELLNDSRVAALELKDAMADQLESLKASYDASAAGHLESEGTWQAELGDQKDMADSTQKRYEDLQSLIDEKFGEQIDSLTKRYKEAKELLKDKDDELLKAKAELGQAQEQVAHYLGIIESIKPQPLKEVKAFMPDGEIVSVDPATGIVILNLGSDDHVYPGLTFSVYNKNAPIPADGKGKAEVEIFDVEKRISIARIKPETVDQKQSIIAQDPIANLIWDADETNVFVVVGDFDIDRDGRRDLDGVEKVKQMIADWQGEVADEVTIETDFVVVGSVAVVPPKPGIDEIDVDPAALEKYEQALAKQARYQYVIDQADKFSIPVFDVSRFMFFIGQGDRVQN